MSAFGIIELIKKVKGSSSSSSSSSSSDAMEYSPGNSPKSNSIIQELRDSSTSELLEYFNGSKGLKQTELTRLYNQDPALRDFIYLKLMQDPLMVINPALKDKEAMADLLGRLNDGQVKRLNHDLKAYHLLELHKLNPAFSAKSIGLMKNDSMRQAQINRSKDLSASSDVELDALHGRMKTKKELLALYRIDIGFAERSLQRLQMVNHSWYPTLNKAYQSEKSKPAKFNQADFLDKFSVLDQTGGACFGFTLNWLVTENFNKRLVEAKSNAEGDFLNPTVRRVITTQYRQEAFAPHKVIESKNVSEEEDRKRVAGQIIDQISNADTSMDSAVLYDEKEGQEHVMGLRIYREKNRIQIEYFDSNTGTKKRREFDPNDTRQKEKVTQKIARYLSESGVDKLSMSLHNQEELKTFIARQERAPASNSELNLVAAQARADARSAALQAVREASPVAEPSRAESRRTRSRLPVANQGTASSSETMPARSAPPAALPASHKKSGEGPSAGEDRHYGTGSTAARSANNTSSPDERTPLLQANINICYTFREKVYDQKLMVKADKDVNYDYITNKALVGGELKEHILKNFALELAPLQGNKAALEDRKMTLLKTPEGDLLKQGQNWFTNKTGIKTDSVKALDKIVEDLAKMEPGANYQHAP